jgi:hypothetical protein
MVRPALARDRPSRARLGARMTAALEASGDPLARDYAGAAECATCN